MEDSFVIIDVKSGALHLMRTVPPLVVSLESTAIAEVAEELGTATSGFQDLDERQRLLWVACAMSMEQPDADSLHELQGVLQAAEGEGKYGNICIALRHMGPPPLIDLTIRRKR